MQIQFDRKPDNSATIRVELNEVDYLPKYENRLREYGKKANFKGFRPGKVPAGLVKKMVGESLLVEEVHRTLSESINNYLKENDIAIVGEPIPQEKELAKAIDWKNQKSFDFEYEVGLIPEFTVADFKKIKVDSFEVKVDEKTIAETKEFIQKQMGESTHPDVAVDGDFIAGDLVAKDSDNEPIKGMVPLNRVSETSKKLFIGAKIGDVITFDINEAMSNDAQQIANLTGLTKEEAIQVKGDYVLTVTEITHFEKAEVNQALFDRYLGEGAVSSEKEFDEKLAEEMKASYQANEFNKVNIKIRDLIVDATKLELSKEFLKRWLKLTDKENKRTDEVIEEEFPLFEKELKWMLIRAKLVKDLDIKVEFEEVKELAVGRFAEQYFGRRTVDGETRKSLELYVMQYLSQNEGKNYMDYHNEALIEKLFTVIRKDVSISSKSISIEEYKNQLNS